MKTTLKSNKIKYTEIPNKFIYHYAYLMDFLIW